MSSAERAQYRYALVLLAEDQDCGKAYYEQHKELLANQELQTIFLDRSSDSYNASLNLISAEYIS